MVNNAVVISLSGEDRLNRSLAKKGDYARGPLLITALADDFDAFRDARAREARVREAPAVLLA